MNIDSIIFDLDGTLWNSLEGICHAWKEVIDRHPEVNAEISIEELESYMGLPMDEIGRRLFQGVDEEFQKKLIEECCETEQVYLRRFGGQLFPALEATLEKLREDYKLFIVSNCQDGYIQCFLETHNLAEYFMDFESWGATGLSKGENNKLLIERNNLKNPIYVGDTNGDALSAEIAEIPFVFAKYGFGIVEAFDYAIDSFEELPALCYSLKEL